MSSSERFFIEDSATLGGSLTFTTEHDLDQQLWLAPNEAAENLKFLLKVHQGEMSPALSRLALKAVTLPLFIREYDGDETSEDTREAIRTIPERNSQLLDAYLDRVGDPDIDQGMLKQAIDDATVLQLASHLSKAEAYDDTILLPNGPEEDHVDKPTTFTVLRRQQLGRALLYVSTIRPAAYIHTPQTTGHRIRIRPSDLLTDDASRFDLAEALIAEQDENISKEDYELVERAAAHIDTAITNHFDRIQPQS